LPCSFGLAAVFLIRAMKYTKTIAVVGVVDDDESIRQSISSLLRSAGYRTILFASAEEFLNYDRKDETEFLVLDVRMPGLSGLELQRRLCELGRSIPILFVTGHVDDEVRTRALKQGAVGYLSKPFNGEDLLGAIQSALRQ